MMDILTTVEGLEVVEQYHFHDRAAQTWSDREAAERELSRWQDDSGWTPQELAQSLPSSSAVIDVVLEQGRPTRLPYVARTAVLDALRCVLVSGLTPTLNRGVRAILCEPVIDTLGVDHAVAHFMQ